MAEFKPNYFQRRTRDKGPRYNYRINSPEVQVIASNGENLKLAKRFVALGKELNTEPELLDLTNLDLSLFSPQYN